MALVTVSSILGRSVVSVKPDATVGEAAKLMRDHRVGSVLVMEGERLVGIVTERDMAYRVLAEGRGPETPVREVMTSDVVTIRDSATLAEAARLMLGLGIRHLPVVDNRGKVIGVVSLRDLAKAIWGSYEPPMTP
ncbi:MAG: CBS domain-containing protein [Desulfurococcales archaeon]|nr:CBS domain-containing protein [Desulfurococcales archaeon]